ncbi:transglutaminaseTgpA domain-containing protein [Psychrobacter aestuarii]|uniref:Protein-glutamine gamma-glutamyltransferase TgpA n=1 Tax=Psychrobacter aestuarii TaxID=556327 RepID=A0ABN0VLI3_9GAMM|nr:DUF3488 and transglutaminase-like domain-containing protein [Psychrobacter aestuarii]
MANNVSETTTDTHFATLAMGLQAPMPIGARSRWQRVLALPAYHWLLIAEVIVIAPHAAHLPLWLIGFALISIAAQLPAIKRAVRRYGPLKRWYQGVQMFGFLLGLLGLWLTYQTAFGLDMGVAFLVLCLVSKLWELYQRRDAYVVLNLSLFVVAALFLMNQGLLTTIQAVAGVLTVLFAFIALNDDGNAIGDGRLRSLGILTLAALPLLVVLFLFFPRLPPLWSVNLSGQQAKTGVSDSMSPGDFANLSQSTELAFRAEFTGERPAQNQLYWRGLVFNDFDGVTWRPHPNDTMWRSGESAPLWLQQAVGSVPEAEQRSLEQYRIILEPTQQNWLFALDYPLPSDGSAALTSNFTLRNREPVTQQRRYDVLRAQSMRIDTELSERDERINVTLPSSGNPQAHALAKRLFAEAGSDPVRYVQALERIIYQGNFRYTLSPPPLGDNRIDDFLFNTQAGFCEHYASSFAFMMRAVGIPARVVAGYQGGRLSRGGGVWEVRQLDAHAWVEVWFAGQGWVRVDPTAFVAPERVESGMDAVTESQGAAMFGDGAGAQISYQQYQMLQALRRFSDQASYYWQKDIVGYDQDKQENALLKWFNIRSMTEQLLWLMGSVLIVATLIVLSIWYRRRQKWHPADRPLVQLSKQLAKQQPTLARQDSEGQLAWLARLATSTELQQHAEALMTTAQHYRQLRYGRLSEKDIKDADYQAALKQLRVDVQAVYKQSI